MPYTARYLYKAKTGAFPTAGQSLRTALGATTGWRAPDDWYIIGWPLPSGNPNQVDNYSDGDGFDWNCDPTVQGAHASQIKRTGAVVTLTLLTSQAGFNIILTTNSIVSGASGSTVHGVIQAPYNPTASLQGSVNFASPGPPDTGFVDVNFTASITGASSGGPEVCGWRLTYVPDGGPFNPTITADFTNIHINQRVESALTDWEYEWHTNSSYTAFYSSARVTTISSDPDTTMDLWLRGRRIGSGGWNTFGIVSWNDPRGPA